MHIPVDIDITTLTLPEQLMCFLHAANGRPYEAVQPVRITAAAELAELVLAGHARLEDDQLVVAHPVHGRRAWITEATQELAGKPRAVRDWVRERVEALSHQQQLGIEHGVLEFGRGRLLGVIGYDQHTVVPPSRQYWSSLLSPMFWGW